MTETREITLACPKDVYWPGEDDSNALPHFCGADVVVRLEWEEGDTNYGADADGNRGVEVPGRWIAFYVAKCAVGHMLDGDDREMAEEVAERMANEQGGDY